jgi:uncharacterized protein (DUF983 family)
MTESTTNPPGRLEAVIFQRCPVCLQGPVFRSFLGMHSDCPNCGIHFERESGYFLNAMFVAYVIGFLIFAPLALILYFQQVSGLWFSIIFFGLLLVLWPFIFRCSRVIWLHVDQVIDPREMS